MTLDDLKAFAAGLDGKALATRFRSRPFSMSVAKEGFEYTPEYSGKPRKQQWKYVERVLKRFNEKRSFHPVDYTDITRNASYIRTVIRTYLDSLSAPVPV